MLAATFRILIENPLSLDLNISFSLGKFVLGLICAKNVSLSNEINSTCKFIIFSNLLFVFLSVINLFFYVHYGKTCKMVPQAGILLHEILNFFKHYKNSDKNDVAGQWQT